jgi:hypothetical protein
MVSGKDMEGGSYGPLNDVHLARLRITTRNITMVSSQTEIRSWSSTKANVSCPLAFAEYEGYVKASGMWRHAAWYKGIEVSGESDASIFMLENLF